MIKVATLIILLVTFASLVMGGLVIGETNNEIELTPSTTTTNTEYTTVNYTQCAVNSCTISAVTGDILTITARSTINNSASANQRTNLSVNNIQRDLITHRTGAVTQLYTAVLFVTMPVTSTGIQTVNMTTGATATALENRIMIEVKR